MHIHIILPTQLFPSQPKEADALILVEEPLLFTHLPYHKMKLAFHRATMRTYFEKELQHPHKLYIPFDAPTPDLLTKATLVTMHDPHDIPIREKWSKRTKHLRILPSQSFLPLPPDLPPAIKHDLFYRRMRAHLHVLTDKEGKPKGGKWSFDTENRDKYKGPSPPLPPLKEQEPSPYVKEAQRYVNTRFPSNPGSCERLAYYPTSRKAARRWLAAFCRHALPHFGRFEDSITPIDHPFLFHSVLSPLLNVGLLTDTEVLEQVLRCSNRVPIASLEGFIRQLIGWRQYVRWVYENHAPSIRIANALKHTRKIPAAFWEARTGMPPVDDVLLSVREWGYAHHIQRLMVLGSFLLLCRCDPAEVNSWFMVSFLDSYDLFMLPNVFCMSQWADGGRYMMKRPYFSSSRYLLNMSSYSPSDSTIDGLPWTTVYDALYYLFLDDHQDLFEKNYSVAAHVARWRRMDEATKKKVRGIARRYLNGLS